MAPVQAIQTNWSQLAILRTLPRHHHVTNSWQVFPAETVLPPWRGLWAPRSSTLSWWGRSRTSSSSSSSSSSSPSVTLSLCFLAFDASSLFYSLLSFSSAFFLCSFSQSYLLCLPSWLNLNYLLGSSPFSPLGSGVLPFLQEPLLSQSQGVPREQAVSIWQWWLVLIPPSLSLRELLYSPLGHLLVQELRSLLPLAVGVEDRPKTGTRWFQWPARIPQLRRPAGCTGS